MLNLPMKYLQIIWNIVGRHERGRRQCLRVTVGSAREPFWRNRHVSKVDSSLGRSQDSAASRRRAEVHQGKGCGAETAGMGITGARATGF